MSEQRHQTELAKIEGREVCNVLGLYFLVNHPIRHTSKSVAVGPITRKGAVAAAVSHPQVLRTAVPTPAPQHLVLPLARTSRVVHR